jgi:rhodanese-related sulfurtransferase
MGYLQVITLSLVVLGIVIPEDVYAIPAPELVVNVVTQGLQLFGLLFAITVSFFTGLFARFHKLGRSAWTFVGGIVVLLLLSGFGAVWFVLSKSSTPVIVDNGVYTTTTTPQVQATEQEEYEAYKAAEEALVKQLEAKYDESTQGIASAYSIPFSLIPQDENSQFVASYYEMLEKKQMSAAIAMTGATKSESELLSWYQDVIHVHLFQMNVVSENRRSLVVGLREKGSLTLYDVIQEVTLYQGRPVKLKLVSSKETKKIDIVETVNRNPLSISNATFDLWQKEQKDFAVLDAREDLEYSYGHFPDSIHARQADVMATPEKFLPKDKPIVVFCFSGGRGSEVAHALREKGYDAYALEDGVKGWVEDFQGKWIGKHRFWDAYPTYARIQYRKEYDALNKLNTVTIDASEPFLQAAIKMPSDYVLPLFSTTNDRVKETLASIPKDKSVIVICQEYTDCFGAKLIAQMLDTSGYDVMGAYDIR